MSTGLSPSIRRSRGCISTVRPWRETQGAESNHKNPSWWEPPDHAIGRSRGGLTCKVHLVSDGKGRPLSWALTAGNINDTTMLSTVLDGIRAEFAGRADVVLDELDGLTGTHPDWSFNVRPSNTEPLLRLNAEGTDRAMMERTRDHLLSLIRSDA